MRKVHKHKFIVEVTMHQGCEGLSREEVRKIILDHLDTRGVLSKAKVTDFNFAIARLRTQWVNKAFKTGT